MLFNKSTDETTLTELIDTLQSQLHAHDADTPEYDKLLAQLERLYKIKTSDKSSKISADTALIVAGNIAGILLVLNFERVGVVTSKALGFILKSKI